MRSFSEFIFFFLPLQASIVTPSHKTEKHEKAVENTHKEEESGSDLAVKGSDEHFDVDYQLKSDIPRAVFKSPSTKDVDEEHESSKLNHYSKLGSAFANNALRTPQGGGRGRGRGRGIQ